MNRCTVKAMETKNKEMKEAYLCFHRPYLKWLVFPCIVSGLISYCQKINRKLVKVVHDCFSAL